MSKAGASMLSGRQSPTKRSRTAVGVTNRPRTGAKDDALDNATPPRSRTPGPLKEHRLPAAFQKRSKTPGSGSLLGSARSGRSSALNTPTLKDKHKLGKYLEAHGGGHNAGRLDHRHGGDEKWKVRRDIKDGVHGDGQEASYTRDAQGNIIEREHGDLIGKYEWNSEEADKFMHLDQGNFQEVPKTPSLDDIFGSETKEYAATKDNLVHEVRGKLKGELSAEEIKEMREEALGPHDSKAGGAGDATTRSVDSIGSVVGREAQAEKLRIKALEATLREKLMSMVPGKNELQKAFKFFDVDDNACVDAAEFRKVFKQLNIPLEMDEARYLFEKYDTNKNNKVEYYEFITQFLPPDTDYNWRDYSAMGRVGMDRVHADLRVHKMIDLLRNDVGPGRLEKYFNRLGTPEPGNEGKLTLLQFIRGLEKEGYKMSSKQWNWLLEIVDKDKSGFISKDEFCYCFGTDEGTREILNGPGEDNTEGFDQFFEARDKVVNAPPIRFRSQASVPTTVLPKDCEEAQEKLPLDEDLTTCVDAVRGLKADFRNQKVSLAQFFKQFDKDGSDWVSRKEFDAVLRKMGYELSEKEIRHMVRSFGVKEWEEGMNSKQFAEILTDDTCDDYGNVRGDILDGRSAVKMGVTSSFPKGIQPDNGDPVRTPKGSTSYMKLDPLARTFGVSGEQRMKTYSPSKLSNTLHPDRKNRSDPRKPPQGEESVRNCLATIQDMIDEVGLFNAFARLDSNRNNYLTPDDLVECLHKQQITYDTAASLCSFMDHNGDGNVSYKDFMTTMAEAARSIPDNDKDKGGSQTRSSHIIEQRNMSPEMRYTRRWDHGVTTALNVPHRYSGRRRHHDTLDARIGSSTSGVAGVLQPRSDSPLFQREDQRLVHKTPQWKAGTMGRVQGWQQDLVTTDNKNRHQLHSSRQRVIQDLRRTQTNLNATKEDRFAARREKTMDLKSTQRFRYFRTVFDPAFEG